MKKAAPSAATSADSDRNALTAEWLAGLFWSPLAIETVRSLRTGPDAAFLDALAFQPECKVGAKRMRAVLQAGSDPAEVARQLAAEFSLLFDGVGGPKTAWLYESAYLGSPGRLFQTPTGDMERLLLLADVSVVCGANEPADHLSIELALLARMMRQGASFRRQSALLDLHLMTFIPLFAARCFEAGRTGFYAAAADLMIGFLQARREALDDRSDPSNLPIGKRGFDIALIADRNLGEAPL